MSWYAERHGWKRPRVCSEGGGESSGGGAGDAGLSGGPSGAGQGTGSGASDPGAGGAGSGGFGGFGGGDPGYGGGGGPGALSGERSNPNANEGPLARFGGYSNTGARVGGAVGSFAGPLGAIAGNIIGGFAGGIERTGNTPTGTAYGGAGGGGFGSEGGGAGNPGGSDFSGAGNSGPSGFAGVPGSGQIEGGGGGGEGGGEGGGPSVAFPGAPGADSMGFGGLLSQLIAGLTGYAGKRASYVLPFEQELFRQLQSILTTGGFEGTGGGGADPTEILRGAFKRGLDDPAYGQQIAELFTKAGKKLPTRQEALDFVEGRTQPGVAETGPYADILKSAGVVPSGGTGAFVPIIGQAVERSKEATGNVLQETMNSLASTGLAGTKYGQQVLAGTRQKGAQEAAGIPSRVAMEALGLGANYAQGAAREIGQTGAAAGQLASQGYGTSSSFDADVFRTETQGAIAQLNAAVSRELGLEGIDLQRELGYLDSQTRTNIANIQSDTQQRIATSNRNLATGNAIGSLIGSIASAYFGGGGGNSS